MCLEENTPIGQRFLIILGELSNGMIRELEEEQMPFWIERAKKRKEISVLKEWNRFRKRDRSKDHAFYTLYAYADIPLGRKYNCLFHRNNRATPIKIECIIEYAVFEGIFPVKQLEHGHKHILFIQFNGNIPKIIPQLEQWSDISKAKWQVGICDEINLDTINN